MDNEIAGRKGNGFLLNYLKISRKIKYTIK